MKKQIVAAGAMVCLVAGVAQARFVSVDPVKANPNNGQNFNRYQYGNNNPYKFVDPDGRRSVVKDGQIYIQPENASVPALAPFPNTVGATGVSPSDRSFHTYDVQTNSALSGAQAGEGFRTNPTPGNDSPASPTGTRNNVGPIPTAGENNYVRSFSVASPDPARFTDVTVNYTVAGEHGLAEGFVMRYGEIGDGGTVLRSYGEGNNWRQNPALENIPRIGWGGQVEKVWQQNHQEIINGAR
ncbi:MAG: hypothetical protein NVV68_07330 [Dokdonella sp.]|nr:hypothetical protein [Dokdonella sp.]